MIAAHDSMLTLLSSTNPERLTKTWRFVDSKPQQVRAGQMVTGIAERMTVGNPEALATLLMALKPNQALAFGLPSADRAPVVTNERLEHAELGALELGAIARTNTYFTWNAGPGWLMLDYDPPKGGDALSRDGLLARLFEVAPDLEGAPMVWSTSSSSAIWNTETGEQVTGIRGQRLYIQVADARDIPRAGKALFDRLWLAGHGYFEVSRSGSLLMRAPVDSSVWQPSRLDFAAKPVCEPPLACRRPCPMEFNNEAPPVNLLTALPNLSREEAGRLEEYRRMTAGVPELAARRQAAREAWIADRLARTSDMRGEEREAHRQHLEQAVEHHRLFGDFELIHSSGRRVTVRDVLDKPDDWHGEKFHDPLEPEYDNSDCRIAWVNLKSGGAPSIYSHAHGGTRYVLYRPAEMLTLESGELPAAVAKVLELLRLTGEVFERSGGLVRVADGELIAVESPWLQNHLESVFGFQRYDERAKKPKRTDCPDRLAQRLLAERGAWGLPCVSAVVTSPFMRPDGSVVVQPGFDPETGLLLLDDNPNRPPVQPLDRPGLIAALQRLWKPFELFPFSDDLSRGVFLAALLTTVTRPALPTAPAFLVRAHTAGTGKTLLSECLMLLVGARPSAMPLPDNADEVEKRLFAKLLTGCPGLILDNLTGQIDGAAMCAFLTSAEPEGRILGKSEARRVENRALWVLNGNNVGAGGDTFRRILPISLDANCEAPEAREYRFNPREVIRECRDAYRADLLSILVSFQQAGAPSVAPGSLGSFEEWERLIRQCVCWLIRERVTPAPMADPLDSLKLSKAEDPRHQQHAAFISAWWGEFGGSTVLARDVLTKRDELDPTALMEALEGLSVGRAPLNDKSLGRWLLKHKGIVVDGLRFDRGDGPQKQPGWRVSRVLRDACSDDDEFEDLIGP